MTYSLSCCRLNLLYSQLLTLTPYHAKNEILGRQAVLFCVVKEMYIPLSRANEITIRRISKTKFAFRIRKHLSVCELDCELSHFLFRKVVGTWIADSCQGSHKFTTLYCLYTMYVVSTSCMCEFCLLILLITRIPSLSSTFLGERTRMRISSC